MFDKKWLRGHVAADGPTVGSTPRLRIVYPVKADSLRLVDEELDRILVVDDHLRFELVTAFGGFAEFDQPRRIQERVSVPLRLLEFHDRSMSSRFKICFA